MEVELKKHGLTKSSKSVLTCPTWDIAQEVYGLAESFGATVSVYRGELLKTNNHKPKGEG